MPFSTFLLVLWTMMDVELLLLSSYTFHQRLGNRCNMNKLSMCRKAMISIQLLLDISHYRLSLMSSELVVT